MTVTNVQLVTNNATGTSVTLTVGATTPGNLLVICHYAGGAVSQASMAGPSGFPTFIQSATTSQSGCAMYWRVADGTESTSLTCTSVTGTSVYNVATFMEWSAGTAWSATPTDASGMSAPTSGGTSITLSTTAADSQADCLLIAAYGLAGTVTIGNTWTDSFTQLATTGSRWEVATKETSAIETPSTTETWTTSRVMRGVIGGFLVPSAAPAATTLQDRPVNRARFRAANW